MIEATATQNLRRFNLDFRDFYAISSLTVNGERAKFVRPGVTGAADQPGDQPRRGRGRSPCGSIYAGKPKPIKDPDKSIEGWIPTDDGAFVVNEPQGAPGWYPVNDNPRDKATYDFTVSVPAGHTVMANGELVSHTSGSGQETWRWREDSPMASYLDDGAPTALFQTELSYTTTASGCPCSTPWIRTRAGCEPTRPNPARAWELLAPQGDIIEYFTGLYGAYPFTSGRRDHRLGTRRGLRPRVADAGQLPPHPVCAAGSNIATTSSTRSPTSGSATRSRPRPGRTSG